MKNNYKELNQAPLKRRGETTQSVVGGVDTHSNCRVNSVTVVNNPKVCGKTRKLPQSPLLTAPSNRGSLKNEKNFYKEINFN